MALPGNGIFVVKGELTTLLTAMKRSFTWSHSYQDDEIDNLFKSLQYLKLTLHRIEDLNVLDPVVFFNPFLEVIRSEDIPGRVTSLSLMAINKFLSYGLLDPTHHNTPMVIDNIADAVTHAKFVGTDQLSDAVVLMQILQVLRTLTLSSEGIMLTNDSLCEIMLACFRICFETRLSELLRKTAEIYLKDMVQLVFMRLSKFPENLKFSNMNHLKMNPGVINQKRARRTNKLYGRLKKVNPTVSKKDEEGIVDSNYNDQPGLNLNQDTKAKSNIVDMQGSISQIDKPELDGSIDKENSVEINLCEESNHVTALQNSQEDDILTGTNTEDDIEKLALESSKLYSDTSFYSENMSEKTKSNNENEYVNRRGIRFTSQNDENSALLPYSLACVREMLRFLISLCNPLDKQNTDTMIHLGLTLLSVAFEVGGDSIGKHECLLTLVKDNLCRNLIELLQVERIAIFAVNLQLSFLIFEALRIHLKFQLELYLNKLIVIITSDTAKVSIEHKELALDYIIQLWRLPGFVTELFVNYDCSMYCSNLFENLTKLLAKTVLSITASGVNHIQLLSLDALSTVIENIETHCIEVTKRKFEQNENITVHEKFSSEISIKNFLNKASTRQKMTDNVPTKEELIKVKNVKKWLSQGNEYFNLKPKKGISFFQEHGVLPPDCSPNEIVQFLRENHSLDKAKIGEYISSRNNLRILEAYVKMFNFEGTRIDEALRMYLETFRLPGEAPLISLVLEHFADQWHKCNGEPFVNADAAFTLAYAVIMLNVDQHNNNVRRQSNPMTCEEFKKNLKGVNGGADFDLNMLDDIYNAIRNEEIVMPAEHTGLVKENYLWKVLLRRGLLKEGEYFRTCSEIYDENLFNLIWGSIISALSFVFNRSDDESIYRRALNGFESCASISSHFGITKNLDTLILTLCKFTLLYNPQQKANASDFGVSPKAQTALKAIFSMVHQHGNNVQQGWKNIFSLIVSLYNLNLVPKSFLEVEDFTEPDGKIVLACQPLQMQKQDSGIFSSLYSYMVSSTSSENLSGTRTAEELIAEKCVEQCNLDQLIIDSKFLREEALRELVKALIEFSQGPDVEKSLKYVYDENLKVFFLELMLKVVTQNRDRVMTVWNLVRDHLYSLMMSAAHFEYQFLLKRSVIGLLRLAIRLMRNEEMTSMVVQSLQMLLLLKNAIISKISVQIAFGLYELLKISAQNIHSNSDWSVIFALLEYVGAGAKPKLIEEGHTEEETKSEGFPNEDAILNLDKGYTSDSELLTQTAKQSPKFQSQILTRSSLSGSVNPSGWILVGAEGEIQATTNRNLSSNRCSLVFECDLSPHNPEALLKCCESLAFLVRDVAHITPYNFDDCVHCVRIFVEASLNSGKEKLLPLSKESKQIRKSVGKRNSRNTTIGNLDDDNSSDDYVPNSYHQVSIQLLDLMHTLYTRTAQIFRWWAEEGAETSRGTSLWTQGWCPLLQGIARLCTDNRRQVRMSAITYLQRALLLHDLQTLNGFEWEACFHKVLFPLLTLLLKPSDPKVIQYQEETRIRIATLLSKVFLHHLTPLLSLPTFKDLWMNILDFMDQYMHADNSDLLYEAIPESMKNMILVMESAKVFDGQSKGGEELWFITWERISKFLPNLREELFNECKRLDNDKKLGDCVLSVSSSQTTLLEKQEDVENTNRSSIILQPPVSRNNVASSLFSHLGQMVSTPIISLEKTESENFSSENSVISTSALENATPSDLAHVFPVLCTTTINEIPSNNENSKNTFTTCDKGNFEDNNFTSLNKSSLSSYFGTEDSDGGLTFLESKNVIGAKQAKSS